MSKTSEPHSLEIYMAQVAHELRDLPSQARADELREVESHLQTMIEARGDVAAVLAQFGAPRKVGRDLRNAWERKQPEAWWRVILAPICAVAFQMFALFLFFEFMELRENYALFTQLQGIFPQPALGIASILSIIFYAASCCVISGFMMGYVSPKRSKWVIAAYFLPILMMLSSEAFGRGVSAFDNASGDSFSVIWSVMGVHLLSTLAYFYGSQIGARYGRKRHAHSAEIEENALTIR